MKTQKIERLQMPRIVMSTEQARTFALAIAGDINKYIDDHRVEYEKWCEGEEGAEGNE